MTATDWREQAAVGARRAHQHLAEVAAGRSTGAGLPGTIGDVRELMDMWAAVRQLAQAAGLSLPDPRQRAEVAERHAALVAAQEAWPEPTTPDAARALLRADIAVWAAEALRLAEQGIPDRTERADHFALLARLVYEAGRSDPVPPVGE